MSNSDFWNNRFRASGHTGWSNPWLYSYDQRNRLNFLKKIIQPIHPDSIMDIGCGTGDFIELVKKVFPACNITAIDISNEVIASARHRFSDVEGVNLVSDDLRTVELGKERYDLLVSVTVLQHITDQIELHKLLKKIRLTLRPNSHFIFLENVYYDKQESDSIYMNKSFSSQEWIKMCHDAGFKVITHSPYPQWGVVIVESIISVLSKLKRTISVIVKGNDARFSNKDNQVNLNRSAQSTGRMLALVTRICLGFAIVLDRVIKFPVPGRLARYEVFICTT